MARIMGIKEKRKKKAMEKGRELHQWILFSTIIWAKGFKEKKHLFLLEILLGCQIIYSILMYEVHYKYYFGGSQIV